MAKQRIFEKPISKESKNKRNSELVDFIFDSNDIFINIIEQSSEGVLISESASGNIIYANKAACDLLGYSKTEILQINYKTIQPEEMPSDSSEEISKDFIQLEESVSRMSCKRKDDSKIHVEFKVSYQKVKNIEFKVCYFRDVSEYFEERIQLKRLVNCSEDFMSTKPDFINYQKMIETITDLSGAEYGFLNIFEDNGTHFTTVAYSGISNIFGTINKILGFDLKEKKWVIDQDRDRKLESSILTKFETLAELTKDKIPNVIVNTIQTTFGIGEVWIAKMLRHDKLLGDFTLIFKKGQSIKNYDLVEIYSRLAGLSITRAKSELKEISLRNRFRAVLDAVPNLVFAKDYAGKYLLANIAFAKTYGVDPKDIVGKNDLDIGFTETEARKFSIADHSVINSGESLQSEMLVRQPNNEEKWFQIIKLPFHLPEADKGAILGVATDITDRKEMIDLLEKRDDLLSKLSRQIPGVIYQFVYRPDGSSYLPFASEGIRFIFEVLPEEVKETSEPIFSRLHLDDYQIVYNSIIQSKETMEDWLLDFRVILPTRGLRWLNGFARPEKLDDGAILWHGFIHDVTERKLLEEKQQNLLDELRETKMTIEINLLQKNALLEEITETKEKLEKSLIEKDKFFSIIAHDLRSPFNGFLGLTRFLADYIDTLSQEDLKDLTTTMRHSAESFYGLLENLLEWSRIKSRTIKFDPILINFSFVVKSNIEILEANLKSKEIELINNSPENFYVFADINMINAVLRNFLTNALKFTRRGGKIFISTNNTPENAIISVSDTGIGIKPDDLKHLFDITKKIAQPGTEGESSTGLGLILCKEYVERHGGKIWVESTLNEGSAFYFSLPHKTDTHR